MKNSREQRESLVQYLLQEDYFLICGHESPDADALGSAYGLFWILKMLGKTVCIRNSDPSPYKYRFYDGNGDIQSWEEAPLDPEEQKRTHLLIVDTNDLNNIGVLGRELLPSFADYYIIDHHEHLLPHLEHQYIDKNASSTSEMIFEIARDLGVSLPLGAAKGLFMGIMFDTGSFIYPKTSPRTFETARDLMELGVSPYEINTYLWESNSIGFLKLQSKVLSSLEIYHQNSVAILEMTAKDLEETEGKYTEVDHLINIPLKSADIRVSIFFKENEEGLLKCSLRSKGDINVVNIAHDFGGGGHKNAAGFKSPYPLAEIKEKVLEKVILLLT